MASPGRGRTRPSAPRQMLKRDRITRLIASKFVVASEARAWQVKVKVKNPGGIHFLLFSRGCGLYLRAPGFDKTISLAFSSRVSGPFPQLSQELARDRLAGGPPEVSCHVCASTPDMAMPLNPLPSLCLA